MGAMPANDGERASAAHHERACADAARHTAVFPGSWRFLLSTPLRRGPARYAPSQVGESSQVGVPLDESNVICERTYGDDHLTVAVMALANWRSARSPDAVMSEILSTGSAACFRRR